MSSVRLHTQSQDYQDRFGLGLSQKGKKTGPNQTFKHYGYHQSLYVEAASLRAINTSVPPSHRSIIRQITLVPPEEVASLYSPREVFASTFWVRFKRGIYKNDIGYVLSWDGDRVDILVAPRDRPYDSDLRKLFFDADAARLAEYTVMVEKQVLEVVEVPHPDDLAFHSLVGINPSLVSQTIKIFSAQLWREGDLVRVMEGELRNTPGCIISVDLENKSAAVEIDYRGLVNYSCLIFELQRVYKHGDSVKIFAGPEKGTSGCILDHRGENLILTVSRHGEVTEVCSKYT